MLNVYCLIMGINFKPEEYQIADRRNHKKRKPIQNFYESLFNIYWWRKTRRNEITNIFLIGFRVDTDTDKIKNLSEEAFGDLFKLIFRINYYLYEIQLNDFLTWGEIIKRIKTYNSSS